jgi:hypothetical protein
MCSFCILTAITVLSGPIAAGGAGAVFIRKVRARHAGCSASDKLEPRPQEKSGYPSTEATAPPATWQEREATNVSESQFALHRAETLKRGES